MCDQATYDLRRGLAVTTLPIHLASPYLLNSSAQLSRCCIRFFEKASQFNSELVTKIFLNIFERTILASELTEPIEEFVPRTAR